MSIVDNWSKFKAKFALGTTDTSCDLDILKSLDKSFRTGPTMKAAGAFSVYKVSDHNLSTIYICACMQYIIRHYVYIHVFRL